GKGAGRVEPRGCAAAAEIEPAFTEQRLELAEAGGRGPAREPELGAVVLAPSVGGGRGTIAHSGGGDMEWKRCFPMFEAVESPHGRPREEERTFEREHEVPGVDTALPAQAVVHVGPAGKPGSELAHGRVLVDAGD